MNKLGGTKGWGKSLSEAILAGILVRIREKLQESPFHRELGEFSSIQKAMSWIPSQRAVV